MADLGQRADSLTEALQAYDAMLCAELDRRRLATILHEKFEGLEPEEKVSFQALAKIMAKNMGF